MSIYDQITDGDTALALVYRLTDSDGRIWRSSPYILAQSLHWNEADAGITLTNQKIRIPTLRHLMRGTVAEIELYLGNVDLQLFQVYPNDPTVDYFDVHPKEINGGTWLSSTAPALPSIEEAVAYVGAGETLYTTGGALENAPPPISRCAYTWRNRAFVANGNDVYPSQEFAPGLGVCWNEITRIQWEDGMGDILAIAHIDWNYLAFFKRDAIGIISGAGPDGMGQGNYIVQTLSTRAGCTNVKSIINGADGLYYQDSQTGRLMLLTPNLQTQECAPGAFDASSSAVTCAMHVEHLRQVWFYSAAPASRLIVLDYKHRTEASPAGSVYQWKLPDSWAVAGMAMLMQTPTLVLSDGSVCNQVYAQFSDIDSTNAPASIQMIMETGDMNPIGLQRQYNLDSVQFLGEYISLHSLYLSIYHDFGLVPSNHLQAFSAAPEQFSARPAYGMRIQATRFRLTEIIPMAGTPPAPVIGGGFKFVGFALVVQDHGKIANLSTARIT